MGCEISDSLMDSWLWTDEVWWEVIPSVGGCVSECVHFFLSAVKPVTSRWRRESGMPGASKRDLLSRVGVTVIGEGGKPQTSW